jgi:hypothetical protein
VEHSAVVSLLRVKLTNGGHTRALQRAA